MKVHITVNVHIAYTRAEIGVDLSSVKGTLHKDRSSNFSVTDFIFYCCILLSAVLLPFPVLCHLLTPTFCLLEHSAAFSILLHTVSLLPSSVFWRLLLLAPCNVPRPFCLFPLKATFCCFLPSASFCFSAYCRILHSVTFCFCRLLSTFYCTLPFPF